MEYLLSSLSAIFTPMALLTLVLGTFCGLVVGMLPGLSSTMAVALCIPITFTLSPEISLILLGAVYVSSVYGGSVTAILLRAPGTDASIATALDGFPLAAAGRASEALGMATIASLFGGLVSVILLLALAPILTQAALSFGAQEYTLLGILGLITIIGVVSENLAKGLLVTAVGLLLACIGLDDVTGAQRFTFNVGALFDGLPLLPMLIGLFSVSQAFNLCVPKAGGILNEGSEISVDGKMFPAMSDIKRSLKTMSRSSIIGSAVGILPGAGTSIAAFISYNEARRKSKNPENFGKGELEGVAASESANNAVTGGTLIPTLTLGIPGNAVTAVFVGGLTIHGMIPGPSLFTEHAETTYTLIFSLLFANILFAVMGILLAPHLAKITKVPGAILGPSILTFSIIGTYALRGEMLDVWLALGFGVVGYFMDRWRYPTAPMVIAVILGPIVEVNFRRSMQISNGDITTFFDRPISLVLVALVVAAIAVPLVKSRKSKRAVT